jgi:hypothetical protein
MHTRKHSRRPHRGGNEVPDYIVRNTEDRTKANKEKNKAWKKELAAEKAKKAAKLAHAMANPRRSARLASKRHGGRRTRRK